MNYFFERSQQLKFVIVDGDGAKDDADTIGELETTMGNIMGAKAQVLTKDLSYQGSSGKRGQIIIRAEAIRESNELAVFKMQWANLNNVRSGCLGMCP